MKRISTILCVLCVFVVQAEPLQFNRDIRPILSENCFACHGFDEKERKAKLRLDVSESAFKKSKDGTAPIVPGKPAESLVWQRIITSDPDDIMPPPESHKKLDDKKKAILKQWIEEGATYQKHWAFEPPTKAKGAGIDQFVRTVLLLKGLKASPDADRPTLIRRVSMALTGLPPTIAEVDAFVADKKAGAYERMVDRYLGSDHFGEEMARHWLDVARYGDTHGMHLDNERQTWAFRDWVVDAFNRNVRFDQFTIEQLAGDLLPEPTREQLVATGFNRSNVTTGEGGSIPAEWIHRYAVDRTSTTAQAWLGLSAGCAECHDHKYDPITQKDFYSLYAFFQSNADPALDGNKLLTQPVLKLKGPDYDPKMKSFAEQEKKLNQEVEALAAKIDYEDPALQKPKPPVTETERIWYDDTFPKGAKVKSSVGEPEFVTEPVYSGKKSVKVTGKEMAQVYYQEGAAEQIVPAGGKFFVHVYLDPKDPAEEIMIQFNVGNWSHRAIWGKDKIDWGKQGTGERFQAGELPEVGKWAKLEFDAKSVALKPGTKVKGLAFTVHGGTAYFDKLGVVARTDPTTDPAQSLTAWKKSLPKKERNALPKDEQAQLRKYLTKAHAASRETFAPVNGKLEQIKKDRTALEAVTPSTFIFRDLPKPRESFVMIRGQYDVPGDKVEPATFAVLPALKKAGERGNRLDLARWLVARENPLTARVAVNRFWQQMFGVGLVESSHDFGTQGTMPTHPELLDWLAVSFMDDGWDVKRLLRLMLTSTTFRQQSAAPAKSWQTDPDNNWLSRGPRFRLDAEQVRDQALFVSGLIKLKKGGKGVNPYQPPNIWEPLAFGGSTTRYYKRSNGDDLYRRTIYTFIKRTAPHPLMDNFDMPNRESSCIRRDRTNTPLQALQLMNDVQHYEAARTFAKKIIAVAPGTGERIDFAYRRALARHAEPDEIATVAIFANAQLARYQAAPEEAKKAINFGESKPPADADPAELAAWALVANLILNLDEAIMRN
ncbi:MAG: PSD1 and planctomycete cytochrome C domain-containing protein [Verrucomicrobiia bacterium]